MNKSRMIMLCGVILLSLILVGMALAADNGSNPIRTDRLLKSGYLSIGGGNINSLSGSFVTFDPSAGGDSCYTPWAPQTFCFRAESFTTTWEFVYNLWEKFPPNWLVTNAYVQGTPACTGGSWGPFSWTFQTSNYEININHPRYQSTTDHCTAYYCFDVIAGAGTADALVSWFWDGDGYGAAPHNPCSSDNYSPAGQNACDEAVNPRASIPVCLGQLEGLVLDPIVSPVIDMAASIQDACDEAVGTEPTNPASTTLADVTCTPATVNINLITHTLSVPVNLTGEYGPIDLAPGTYQVEASAEGYATGTAEVIIVSGQTTTQDFDLQRPGIDVNPLSLSVTADPGVPVVVSLDISNQGELPLEWEITEGLPLVPSEALEGTYKQQPAASGMDLEISQQMASSADGKADVFIAFKDTADLTGAYNLNSKEEKVAFVREALRKAADHAQGNVRLWLDQHGIAYQIFNIDNTLLVHIDQSTLDILAAFPEISGFQANHIYSILSSPTDMPLSESTVESPVETLQAIIPWNLDRMSVPQVWNELGVTGKGVIVATVDTGVNYLHEALYPNYLCRGGPHTNCWYDPSSGTTIPDDAVNHGTATLSQIAADNNDAFQYAVGAAPEAGWITCLGCPGGSCPASALNACADWLVMSTPYTPDIVSNAWGMWSATCDTWYASKLQAYRAAGILPVFTAGTIGNVCNTSTPPANNPGAFAVGATDSSDAQASFSSSGPGLCVGRTQFPDVVAPGVSTCGALEEGGYLCNLSGSGFAASLTAGCLALVKSANPSLTVDELEDAVMSSADNILNSDCGSPQPDPNYRYGDGRVNCLAAASEVYSNDLPWVSESPTTGMISPAETQQVNVTFECTPAQDGQVLTGTLRINNNDPCHDPVQIPIELICGGARADIEVVPLEMAAGIMPDTSETQSLSVCNAGDEALHWGLQEDVLFNNGPLITHPAGGGGGADASALQSTLQMINYGWGAQYDFGYRIADDFEITAPEGMNIQQITFFAYQTNAPVTPSPFTAVYYQIWDGPPDHPGSSIVFGDLITNRLVSSNLSNIYRVSVTNLTNTSRMVFSLVASAGVTLPPGTYWLDWSIDGNSSYSGPWVPPVTVLQQRSTGNALQWTIGPWSPIIDNLSLTSQGMPFVIKGPVADLPWLVEDQDVGTLPAGNCADVAVTFNSTGITLGSHLGNLWADSNDPTEFNVTIPVTLTVGYPEIATTPSSIDVTLHLGESRTSHLIINNLGTINLDWELFAGVPWLSVDPLFGTTLPGGLRDVPVVFETDGLAPGEYHATITITSNDPDEAIFSVPVTLRLVKHHIYLPISLKR